MGYNCFEHLFVNAEGMIELTVAKWVGHIGYCGLACDFCHLWGDCGGCQSPDNHCRKRLAPEGCYQYACCNAKGLNGCWECTDFSCSKDMFAPGHGVRIKAFVRCAREDGVAQLAWYLQRNAEQGIRYHIGNTERGDYDNLADEAEVLRLLRDGRKQDD
jgi:hypothetical protein